jgi:hypothetical protein
VGNGGNYKFQADKLSALKIENSLFINPSPKKGDKMHREAKPYRFPRGITFLNMKDSERESIWLCLAAHLAAFFGLGLIVEKFYKDRQMEINRPF